MMQFISKSLASLAILILPLITFSQSTYLPQGHKHQQFLNRMEIKMQRNPEFNVTTVKPLSRHLAVLGADQLNHLKGWGFCRVNVDKPNAALLMTITRGSATHRFYPPVTLEYSINKSISEVTKDFSGG